MATVTSRHGFRGLLTADRGRDAPSGRSMQVLAWTTRDPARICPITGRYGRCFGLRDNLVFSVAARGGPAALERVTVTELARDRAKGGGGAPSARLDPYRSRRAKGDPVARLTVRVRR